jgi:hypothetical protein
MLEQVKQNVKRYYMDEYCYIIVEDENTWYEISDTEEGIKEYIKDRILEGLDTSKLKIFKAKECWINIKVNELYEL